MKLKTELKAKRKKRQKKKDWKTILLYICLSSLCANFCWDAYDRKIEIKKAAIYSYTKSKDLIKKITRIK